MVREQPSPLVDEIARLVGWREDISPEKEWSAVEREIGTRLPVDYKELMSRFPSGIFRGISIDSPVASEESWTLYKRDQDQLLEFLGDDDLEYLKNVSYRVFPEPGGLLPWGTDGQGGTLCWITDSPDPDNWTIAYHDAGADQWREHPGPAVRLVLEILSNTGEDNILRWNLDNIPVEFTRSG